MTHQRIEHLDSLRVVAALAVVFGHSIGCFKGGKYGELIYSITAHSAVVFFFLLSGFVLSRSLERNNALSTVGIIGYGIRRLFRLYPMVLVTLLLGALVVLIIEVPLASSSSSEWFREQIIHAKSVKTFSDYFNEILMRCQFLNPPLWTIRAEFQCSIALPFLIIIQKKGKAYGIMLGICLAVYLLLDKGAHKSSFLLAFYLGHLVNVFSSNLGSITSNFTKFLLLILLPTWMMVASDWLMDTLILSLIFALLVPCHWVGLKKILERPSLKFLGKTSFSLYAIHMPMLFLVWNWSMRFIEEIFPAIPVGISEIFIFVLTVSVTLPLAAITERFVERPWNDWGHLLSNCYTQKFAT